MDWLQFLFGNNGKRISELEIESANRAAAIRMLSEDNGRLKQENAQLKKGVVTVPNFSFDPALVETITAENLRVILSHAFPGAEVMLNDITYQYTTLAEVQRWASFDPTNELKYRAEQLDCDKFALTDMANFKSENNYQLGNAVFGIGRGNAAGIGYHEWNIAYVAEGLITLEPQSDKITNWKDNQDYNPDFIYV